ncbi:MAG: hypothetical protein MN733_04185 [Nitrososphaera sp.]|nr:hypothetical protein [Nitrososphaera sp.]
MNRKLADRPPMIIVQGSCIQFEKERPKIMDFIASLESRVHSKSKCECSSSGKALGWDFFRIYFVPEFVERLLDVYPEIQKQEGNDVEQRFVLWLNKEMKKARLEHYLKLSDVPRESVGGFRLNPEAYRDDSELEKLR